MTKPNAKDLAPPKDESRSAASRLVPATTIGLIALVTALLAGSTFRRATTPWSTLPYGDYWGNISGLVTARGLDLNLASLFRHNNEHIVVIPKLIYAANYLTTSGSNIGLIVYSIAAGAACSALLLFLAIDLLRDTPWRLLVCAVLFPLVMFSAKLSHTYFLGASGTIWLTADLLVIVSAAALAKAMVSGRPAWLLTSLLAALLGVLTYSTAIYSLIALLGFCLAVLFVPRLRGFMPTGLLMGTIALIAVVLGVGIAYRNRAHPSWVFDPLALVRFMFTYLGNALTMGPSRLQALLAPLIGMAILVIGGLSIRRLWSEERLNKALLWIILFFFAPFSALMTGIGRLSSFPNEATVSRYQSVAAISLIATIALMLAALPRTSTSRGVALLRGATVATLLIAAIVLATNREFVKDFTVRNETKVLAEIALRQSLESEEHLNGAMRDAQELSALVPILRAASHVPFNTNTRCESLLGRRLAETAGEPAGSVEAISTYAIFPDRGKAVELIGWAERDGASAECIVVIDGRRTAIGAGGSMFLRPDTERDKGQPLGRIGWKAVATLPEVMPVCAIALFRGEGEAVPLANCQGSIRGEPIGLQGEPGKP